jgi:phosphoglycerate kinase
MIAFGTAHWAHASTAVIAQFFPPEKRLLIADGKRSNSAEKYCTNSDKPFLSDYRWR